jgi:predicted P-loop ATPase
MHGASPKEWSLLDLVLGFTADLLPVVSNKNAVISPHSKITQLGKTPSMYDKKRQAIGFVGWTAWQASQRDVDRWSREPDYGICVQTRRMRALDIDVSDPDKARKIVDFIVAKAGIPLPLRSRANDGKCLLAFVCEGELRKRVLKVDGGIVELLGNGQQFIFSGTHPSGARYEWMWPNELHEIPQITMDQLHQIWNALEAEFGIAPSVEQGGQRRPRGNDLQISDPIVNSLDVLDWGSEGQVFIRCPFEHEHTTETGPTATCYFPKGTRGYEQGHFKCLHAHCAERSDEEFMDALELRSAAFDVIEADPLPQTPNMPALRELHLTRRKDGTIVPDLSNVAQFVSRYDITKYCICFDEFLDEIMLANYTPEGALQWRPFDDVDYIYLRLLLQGKGFGPISRETMQDAVRHSSATWRIDSAIEWSSRLEWDGKPRVSNFLHGYFNAKDNDYTRAVSEYMWTALAGRVVEPGIKADMVPVLVGAQGAGKSFGVSELVPSPDYFQEINLIDRDADLARRMRGKLVLEIGELRGLMSRDMESIKEFITRRHESWVPKYKEFATRYPRRGVFIGTTNQHEFLSDMTGNRRWLPVDVGKVDVDGIRQDRSQLWAEALAMFKQGGIRFANAERLGREVVENYTVSDSWADAIAEWLDTPDEVDGATPRERKFIKTKDVAAYCLRLDVSKIRRGDELRIGGILRAMGFEKKVMRVGGELCKGWHLVGVLPL